MTCKLYRHFSSDGKLLNLSAYTKLLKFYEDNKGVKKQ
jgi:hypothetical protein